MPFIGNKPSAVPLASADIADSIITSAKIVDGTIANADIANSTINLTTKVTGTLPVANGGTGLAAIGTSLQVLRTNTGATALEFATPTLGLKEADQWRLTTDFSSDADITTNLERVDTYGFGLLGTGMTQSSGIFTFPSTGYWLIQAQGTIFSNQYGNTMLSILVTTNNSTYNYSNQIRQGNANYGVGDEPNATGSGFSIVNVTSTANVKVKFRTNSFGGGSILRGDTNTSVTSFMFIKLGEA